MLPAQFLQGVQLSDKPQAQAEGGGGRLITPASDTPACFFVLCSKGHRLAFWPVLFNLVQPSCTCHCITALPFLRARLQVKQALYASTSVYCGAAGLLSEQLAAAKAASCFRGVLQMQHAHMQLALQRVLHLQTFKPAQMQHLLSGLTQQELAVVLGLPDPEHNISITPLGTSLTSSSASTAGAAAASSSGASDTGSSSSSWSVSVTAAVAARKAGSAHWVKFVLRMQQEVLSAIDALGTDALSMHAAHQPSKTAASTDAGQMAAPSSSGSSSLHTADAVRTLLKKLPEVWESVQQDTAAAEMAGVLQALFNAEFARGYGTVASFMRGHLHQCPNGHFFVIGECGGAMQESRCMECGAVVGGAHHQLASGNQQAGESVLEQLQEQWGGAGSRQG
jgi:hypothetical protein